MNNSIIPITISPITLPIPYRLTLSSSPPGPAWQTGAHYCAPGGRVLARLFVGLVGVDMGGWCGMVWYGGVGSDGKGIDDEVVERLAVGCLLLH